jgi:hypothetical protein
MHDVDFSVFDARRMYLLGRFFDGASDQHNALGIDCGCKLVHRLGHAVRLLMEDSLDSVRLLPKLKEHQLGA